MSFTKLLKITGVGKSVNQFSSREKHFTMHVTLLIIDKIQRAIENRLFSSGIFLDFSKGLLILYLLATAY